MLEEIFEDVEKKMDKAIEATEHEMASLRTGRASVAVLDGVMVNAYGSDTPLNQVATLAAPDATLLTVQPWDPTLLGAIEKALLGANLGMTPSNDGKVIRLAIPAMTEEARKEKVKKLHDMAEHGRIAIRGVRRHANDEIKKTEKHHDISEDDRDRFLKQVQTKTDAHVKRIDELMGNKESEIMTV